MKKPTKRSFGPLLHKLRSENGYSIKGLAKKLEVNYSYLSKLENGHSLPSEAFIKKIGVLFGYDNEELMVRAGKLPEDIINIISNNPKVAIDFLRKSFQD